MASCSHPPLQHCPSTAKPKTCVLVGRLLVGGDDADNEHGPVLIAYFPSFLPFDLFPPHEELLYFRRSYVASLFQAESNYQQQQQVSARKIHEHFRNSRISTRNVWGWSDKKSNRKKKTGIKVIFLDADTRGQIFVIAALGSSLCLTPHKKS